MKKWLPLGLIFFALSCSSAVQLTNPASVAPGKGYSQAAVVDLGSNKMIILSGQVPLDKQGNLVGKGDLEKQTEQVFTNIKSIAEEMGGNMSHVIKLSYYITDVSQIQTIRNVRDKYINTTNPPASTLVQVSKLFRDDVMIEVEATLVIPTRR
ncbi:MAG: RidA family protein [Filimonas sp.]|nr:RidA family protein [Filimonas sp.]